MEKYLLKKFEKLNPCSEGLLFVNQFLTPKEAWKYCKNPNWMAWYLNKNINRLDLLCALYEEVKSTVPTTNEFYRFIVDSHDCVNFVNIWVDKELNKAYSTYDLLSMIGKKYAETKDMNYGCLYMYVKTVDNIEHCVEVFDKLAFLKGYAGDFPVSDYIRHIYPTPPDLKD